MSNNTQNQMTENVENRPKIMTGYVHYDNKTDDLAQLFQTLNEFRKNRGLKYSHQDNVGLVFFNISSEHLEELSKVRPFKISKFQTKSEYYCDKETSEKLMGQKDSFLRMNWDEQTNVLTFMSRTTSRVHGNLVRRIFKDSGVNFNKSEYTVLKDYFKPDRDEQKPDRDEQKPYSTNETAQTNSTHQESIRNTKVVKSTNSSKNSNTQVQEESQVPEGFQRVVRKNKSSQNTKSRQNIKSSQDKVSSQNKVQREKEDTSKPKVRGSKAPKAPITNA